MLDWFQALWSGMLRPLGPLGALWLPVALVCGLASSRDRVRDRWALVGGLVLFTLAAGFVDADAFLRGPSFALRLGSFGAVLLFLGQLRWPSVRGGGVILLLSALAMCLPQLPGPRSSVLDASWPGVASPTLAWTLALGSALTLAVVVCGGLHAPRMLRKGGVVAGALLALCIASGLASWAMRWLLLQAQPPLLG